MGVTLDLRLIDHERIVVRGLQIVNAAIREKNAELLRSYLAGLPVDVDPTVVEYRLNRLSKLRDLNAPAIIIENEERHLRFANGEAYRPEEFKNASFDELRQILGTWCWPSHCYSLDKLWQDLQWFLQPGIGPNYPLCLHRPRVGDPEQTIIDKALQGSTHYPLDDLGDPIIRTLGSTETDCFGYNPPEVVLLIHESLKRVDPDTWEDHVAFRRDLYRQDSSDMDDAEIASRVDDDLLYAREMFSILVAAYDKALEKKYGVSCEFSL